MAGRPLERLRPFHARVIHAAPALRSGCGAFSREIHDHLEAALREEAGADPAGPLPGLIAGRIAGRIARIHQTVFVAIGREMAAGRKPDEVSREVLVLLDDIEELLSGKVLNCAVRGGP